MREPFSSFSISKWESKARFAMTSSFIRDHYLIHAFEPSIVAVQSEAACKPNSFDSRTVIQQLQNACPTLLLLDQKKATKLSYSVGNMTNTEKVFWNLQYTVRGSQQNIPKLGTSLIQYTTTRKMSVRREYHHSSTWLTTNQVMSFDKSGWRSNYVKKPCGTSHCCHHSKMVIIFGRNETSVLVSTIGWCHWVHSSGIRRLWCSNMTL